MWRAYLDMTQLDTVTCTACAIDRNRMTGTVADRPVNNKNGSIVASRVSQRADLLFGGRE